MDQVDQVRRQAGFLGRGIKNGFEPRIRLEFFPHSSTTAMRGLLPAPKGTSTILPGQMRSDSSGGTR